MARRPLPEWGEGRKRGRAGDVDWLPKTVAAHCALGLRFDFGVSRQCSPVIFAAAVSALTELAQWTSQRTHCGWRHRRLVARGEDRHPTIEERDSDCSLSSAVGHSANACFAVELTARFGSTAPATVIADSSRSARQPRATSQRWTPDFRSAGMTALGRSGERDWRPRAGTGDGRENCGKADAEADSGR
jgi:hypothetical protein